MIVLEEIADVGRSAADIIRYVADFRHTPEWDATAYRAEKLTEGPVAEGTHFKVWCRLPVGHIVIDYRIVELEPAARVVLAAECALFDAVDTITVEAAGEARRVRYRAEFDWKGPLNSLEGAFERGMRRMGKASVEGLARALDGERPAVRASRGTRRADRWVWPGVALFSSLGYRRGQKHWEALSENLAGRHIVITGATSGIGHATAERLARMGASLTLVMRDRERGERVVNELCRETGNDAIRLELADLALMRDVDALSDRLLRRGDPVDVLVNNAGALFNERSETEEGLERSFALLLLAPYRLTTRLHPLLRAAAPARVVNVVSGGMYTQRLEVQQLQAREENYSGSVAYARCKRALMVLTEQWAEAWRDDGISVNAMHPGWADTPGVRTSLPGFHRVTRTVLRSPEEGADTVIWLAASREAADCTGQLFLDREPRPTHLLKRTRESAGEREQLREYLAAFDRDADGTQAA